MEVLTSAVAIERARVALGALAGRALDVIDVREPRSIEAAVNLARIVSKLSPIVGNLIEFSVVDALNQHAVFQPHEWIRQDPGFPDAVLDGLEPETGFEVKAWFPFATEITGRFKESQARLEGNEIHLCVLAWLPSNLVYGTPEIIDVGFFPALSVAQARDAHYHQPPRYLVVEPQDTSGRTRNLQQTNTNGLRFQGDAEALAQAEQVVASWGASGMAYSKEPEYQAKVESLRAAYPYRGDTNYAKIDRIEHPGIEAFKTRVLGRMVRGRTIAQWRRALTSNHDAVVAAAMRDYLDSGSVR